MRTLLYLIALALSGAALLLPARVVAESLPSTEKSPVILFWTDKPALVPHATFVTPSVSLAPLRVNDPLSQAELLAHGVMPLAWCPGQSLAQQSDAEILATWTSIIRKGYIALGIDELGGWNHAQNARFARLLVQFHEEHPTVYIAVWSAGIIDPALARAYRTSVNLVMIEAYGPWGLHQWERFTVRLTEARLFGIVHKCIFAIGIDDAAPPAVLRSEGAWSNTPADLQKQIRWIAKHAPDMPGVGFFAPDASDGMLGIADALAHRYFPVRAVASRPPGTELVGPRRLIPSSDSLAQLVRSLSTSCRNATFAPRAFSSASGM